MEEYNLSPDEADRLADLESYHILDTHPEQVFDNITALAATICNVPYALLSFIDAHRQWFKSAHEIPGIREIPMKWSICAHSFLEAEYMEIEDALKDPRFSGNPLVEQAPKFRFYAGVPLLSSNGNPIGTLSVLGLEPKRLNQWQQESLRHLGQVAMQLLEDRKAEYLAQQALTLSENRFRSTFEHAAMGVAHVGMDGRWLLVNQKLCDILGYTADELTRMTQQDVTFPEDLDIGPRYLQQVSAGSANQMVIEKRYRRKDGSVVWVNLTASPLRDEAGKPLYLIVTVEDVTERKNAEAAARRANALVRQTLESISDAFFAVDNRWVFTYANDAAEQLLARSREDLLGRNIWEEFPEAVELDFYKYYHQAKQQGKAVTFEEYFPPLDTWFSVRAYPYTDGLSVYFQNVNERRRIEQALRESEEKFRILVEGAKDYAIIQTDQQGLIVSWSKGAEQILQYSDAEAIGQPDDLFFTPEDRAHGRAQREMQEAMTMGRSEDERWHLRKDGTRFWASGILMPLWNGDDSLKGFVKILRDNTARHIEIERTHFLATHDPLTGLANRAYFSTRLHDAIASAQKNDYMLAVLMLDLDRFKVINDTLGHHIGDLLLKEVAARLSASVQEVDTVARLGGDEFAIIQISAASQEAVHELADRLVDTLEKPFHLDGREIHSGTSIGVTLYPQDGQSAVQLLKNADMAMYKAKSAGRHNFQIFTQAMGAEVEARDLLENDLRQALQNNEFELYYQPQIDLEHWQVSGVEALLRWQNPRLQLLTPAQFIDLAEETGLIVPIGAWVLKAACVQAKTWQQAGIPLFRITVNISGRQARQMGFGHTVQSVINETGISPSCLELDFAHGVLIQSSSEIRQDLVRLRELGVHLSSDDFGAGFSSLSHIKEFPIDVLKISPVLVAHLPHNAHDAAVTSSIIRLAKNLNLRVVAEGVETAEQLAFLIAQGGQHAQGFLFSEPVPAGQMEQLLREADWSHMNQY